MIKILMIVTTLAGFGYDATYDVKTDEMENIDTCVEEAPVILKGVTKVRGVQGAKVECVERTMSEDGKTWTDKVKIANTSEKWVEPKEKAAKSSRFEGRFQDREYVPRGYGSYRHEPVPGYDRFGYDRYGFDINGYDRYGYNRYGVDRWGYDRYGVNRSRYPDYQWNPDRYRSYRWSLCRQDPWHPSCRYNQEIGRASCRERV